MKQIDTWYHMIRELMKEGEMELVKVHTKKNSTGTLRKVLSLDSFHKCVTLMGLMDRMEFVEALRH